MQFEKRANDALNANGFTNTVTVNNHITTHGSDWYFAVCAVMICSTGAFMGLSFTKPRTERIFHYITAGITMVAAVAYFSMGANLGWTGILVEFARSNPKVSGDMRQIFYVSSVNTGKSTCRLTNPRSDTSIGSSPHHFCCSTYS